MSVRLYDDSPPLATSFSPQRRRYTWEQGGRGAGVVVAAVARRLRRALGGGPQTVHGVHYPRVCRMRTGHALGSHPRRQLAAPHPRRGTGRPPAAADRHHTRVATNMAIAMSLVGILCCSWLAARRRTLSTSTSGASGGYAAICWLTHGYHYACASSCYSWQASFFARARTLSTSTRGASGGYAAICCVTYRAAAGPLLSPRLTSATMLP